MSASPRRKPLPKRRRPLPPGDGRATDDVVGPQPNDEEQLGKECVQSKDITGLKYFNMLLPLLQRLHDDQCQRDKANNRDLHFDQYCMLVLLYLFNPTVTSLRAIQQASELEKVQKKLGCSRVSLGSLSEASRLFDPERLKAIIGELGEQANAIGRHKDLKEIAQTITLVDGSLVAALPNLVQASLLKATTGSGAVKWRLHTHFEVDRYIPSRIDVTPDEGGEHDERAVLERTLQKDHLYVMDRGYAKFALFNNIVDLRSSYVCRLRDNSAYEALEDRPLSEADQAAGVLSDQVISIGSTSNRPNHRVRLICVYYFTGLADEEELIVHLGKLKRHDRANAPQA